MGDPAQKAEVLEQYQEKEGISWAEAVCKQDWHLMEMVLLGVALPPAWVWARTLYESCFGGLTGLGTDEETLASIMVLNWSTQSNLTDALLAICKYKGHETTIEKLLE